MGEHIPEAQVSGEGNEANRPEYEIYSNRYSDGRERPSPEPIEYEYQNSRVRVRSAVWSRSGRDKSGDPTHASNQDSFYVSGGVAVLADGVGGYAGGETASMIAVSIIGRTLSRDPDNADRDDFAFDDARAVIGAATYDKSPLEQMAAAVLAAKIVGDRLYLGVAGDVRAGVRHANGDFAWLTEEQALADGRTLANWVGGGSKQRVLSDAFYEYQLLPGDRLVIATDGALGDEAADRRPDSWYAHALDPERLGAAQAVRYLVTETPKVDDTTVVIEDVDFIQPESGPAAPGEEPQPQPDIMSELVDGQPEAAPSDVRAELVNNLASVRSRLYEITARLQHTPWYLRHKRKDLRTQYDQLLTEYRSLWTEYLGRETADWVESGIGGMDIKLRLQYMAESTAWRDGRATRARLLEQGGRTARLMDRFNRMRRRKRMALLVGAGTVAFVAGAIPTAVLGLTAGGVGGAAAVAAGAWAATVRMARGYTAGISKLYGPGKNIHLLRKGEDIAQTDDTDVMRRAQEFPAKAMDYMLEQSYKTRRRAGIAAVATVALGATAGYLLRVGTQLHELIEWSQSLPPAPIAPPRLEPPQPPTPSVPRPPTPPAQPPMPSVPGAPPGLAALTPESPAVTQAFTVPQSGSLSQAFTRLGVPTSDVPRILQRALPDLQPYAAAIPGGAGEPLYHAAGTPSWDLRVSSPGQLGQQARSALLKAAQRYYQR